MMDIFGQFCTYADYSSFLTVSLKGNHLKKNCALQFENLSKRGDPDPRYSKFSPHAWSVSHNPAWLKYSRSW